MTRLDDLLRYDEDLVPARPRRRSVRVRVALAVVACFLTAYALHVIFGLTGVGIPYPFLVCLLLAVVALRTVLGGVAARYLPSTLRKTPLSPSEDVDRPPDGVRQAVHRWAMRLDWTSDDLSRFGSVVRPAIVDIVDERLRLHHGISRGANPDRARELVGLALWTFLHQPVTHSLTPRDLAVLVTRMEEL